MIALSTVRLVSLVTIVVFSIVTLGLAAHLTDYTNKLIGGYYTFAALAMASAMLSIVSIPVMLLVDTMKRSAFTSMIAFELIWLGFLWVLWLASAGSAAQANLTTFKGCHFFDSSVNTACHEFGAIEAFSFLNWLILFGYTITLGIFSVRQARLGTSIWSLSLREANSPSSRRSGYGFEKPQRMGVRGGYPPTLSQPNPTYQV
jgi:hypothetical protein